VYFKKIILLLFALLNMGVAESAPRFQRVVIPELIDKVSEESLKQGYIPVQTRYQAPLPAGLLDQVFLRDDGRGSVGWLDCPVVLIIS
jgi:hypothetical protein